MQVNDEIRKRYEELLKIVENAYFLKINKLNNITCHDERNMVLNLRKKIDQKKIKKIQ